MEDITKKEYGKKRIQKAGSVISHYSIDSTEYRDNIPVIDYWRAVHAYPTEMIYNILNSEFKNEANVYVVQRLKRLESIINKLKRMNSTDLFRMQDLGGCRVIVPDVEHVYTAVEIVKKNLINNGHEIERETDYIQKPREISGYRSYHIVVKYRDENSSLYNGMLIEIQIRSKLEHTWATTVEIMDFITEETLKAGTGREEYMLFFKLVSALFSIHEQTPIVEGVAVEKKQIIENLYMIDEHEKIREKLAAYRSAIKFSGNYASNSDYYLLIIDMRKKRIRTIEFSKQKLSDATSKYHTIERNKKNGTDVVLVAAKNFNTIKESYPNYFLETATFLSVISSLCREYPEPVLRNSICSSKDVKISSLFNREYHKAQKVILPEDSVGVTAGKVYACPDFLVSLDNSYLRFSGIVLKETDIPSGVDPISMSEPSIVAVSSGAAYYINAYDWKFVCGKPSITITSRSKDTKSLLFLLAWLKSNIFTWNCVMRYHVSSIVSEGVFNQFFMPDPTDEDILCVADIAQGIVNSEKTFVEKISQISDDNIVLPLVDSFNDDIKNRLIEIEDLFAKYYRLDNDTLSQIKEDLQFNGYFSYR